MIVSTTNIASDATITATPDSVLQDINVVADGDYSSVYSDALSGTTVIQFLFDEAVDIGYLAIGGSNISKKDTISIAVSESATVQYWRTVDQEQIVSSDGFDLTVGFGSAVDDSALGNDESVTLMYKVDQTNVRRVTITVKGSGTLSISEIAMGEYYTIPRGQQSGYKMSWTVPNIQSRGATTIGGAPINLSFESRTLSATLTVPNNIMSDFDGWYKFIKFAASSTFYVLEDENRYHAYAAFNAVPSATTNNASTRSLGSSSITFQAFAKSTEALFSV